MIGEPRNESGYNYLQQQINAMVGDFTRRFNTTNDPDIQKIITDAVTGAFIGNNSMRVKSGLEEEVKTLINLFRENQKKVNRLHP